MKAFENKIICGDCTDLLPRVDEPFADLIFADPPFNIGYKYDKYHDKLKSERYLKWTRDWMEACVSVLKPAGSFYIAIGAEYAANVRLIGDDLGLTLRNWIIWHYTFGQQTKAKFARAHTHIFYFCKDKDNFTFNDHAVRVPSDRQLKYNDKRANAAGKMPDDVWSEYSRVCGTFKERQGWHPCQMPENLLARIIAASSNEGDLVFDPFMGSGTTATTAVQMNRRYCGTEISENYVEKIRERIEQTKKDMKGSKCKRFSAFEMFEIKRLLIDMGIDIENIRASKKYLAAFCSQLEVRLGGKREFEPVEITEVLGEFPAWTNKR